MPKQNSEAFFAGRRVLGSERMVGRLDEILLTAGYPAGLRINSVVSVALQSVVLAIPLMQEQGLSKHMNGRASAARLVAYLEELPEAQQKLPATFGESAITRPSKKSTHSVLTFAADDPATRLELLHEEEHLAELIQRCGAQQKVGDVPRSLWAIDIPDAVWGETLALRETCGTIALRAMMAELSSLSGAGTMLGPVELMHAPPRGHV